MLSLQANRGVPTKGPTADAKLVKDSLNPFTVPRVDGWKEELRLLNSLLHRNYSNVYANFFLSISHGYMVLVMQHRNTILYNTLTTVEFPTKTARTAELVILCACGEGHVIASYCV